MSIPSERFRRSEPETVIAVVGLGYWGPNLLRVLADRTDVRVKWICDADETRLQRFARRYPGAQSTSRYGDILADPEVEAVVLATPVFTHYDLGMEALQAGKHTFIEKPLAASTELALELHSAAVEQQLLLMCGHTFVYSPAVGAVGELITSDAIGDVYFISSSRVNLGLHQPDVSVIWDLGPHDFSILRHWLGEAPTSVRAVGRDSIVPGIPDVAFVTLTFPSGVVANVELSWLAPSKLRRTVVVGSKKMVVYDDGAVEPVRVFDHGVVYEDPATFGEYHLSYRTGDILSPKLDTQEPLAAEMEDFIHGITSGESVRASAELAYDVVRIAEAADQSLRSGGELVNIEETAALFHG
jgi:predicted dehydrogenase